MASHAVISLHRVGKVIGKHAARRWILNEVSTTFDKSDHYVVLGLRGAGKSTFLKILSGISQPSRGIVSRRGSISFPSGYAPGLGAGKTVRDLIKLMAGLYEADFHEVTEFVARFSGLESFLEWQFAQLPPIARARVCYSLVYAIPADVLLFDDGIDYGDAEFRRNCYAAFEYRRKTSGAIVATRETRSANEVGSRGAVLHNGELMIFPTVDEAVQLYRHLQVEDAQAGVAYAETLIKQGEMAKAQEYLKRHLSEGAGADDTTGEAYELLADLSVKLGNHEDAQHALRAALDHLPDSPSSFLLLAKIAEREARYHDAIDYAERVLELSPGEREAQSLSARSYEALSMNDEAARIWLRLAADTNDQLSFRLAIRNFVKADDWFGVVSAIDSIAGQVPDPSMMELKARAHVELKQWNAAKAPLTLLLEKAPEKAIRILERGLKTSNWLWVADFLNDSESERLKSLVALPKISSLVVLLEKHLGVQLEEGAMDNANSLERVLSFISPQFLAESLKRNAKMAAKGEVIDASMPDLNSAERIVQELYELRTNRSRIESSLYADRNKAAWAAARTLATKFERPREE